MALLNWQRGKTHATYFFSSFLRLDFDNFVSASPPTSGANSGSCPTGTDFLTVTSPTGASPPVVCGTLTGQHSKYFTILQDYACVPYLNQFCIKQCSLRLDLPALLEQQWSLLAQALLLPVPSRSRPLITSAAL